MDRLAALLLGSFIVGFAGIGLYVGAFRVRHWSDWQTRWADAPPALRFFVLMVPPGYGAERRSRRESLLWEAPGLFISACLLVAGSWLVAVGPGEF